ncbi:MAG: hypothetical protein CSA11_01655 [Chloroflexi bacterium]|nr:MAG: hypothetical protein CSA11_01655 [Chloroflexota bacterium]
MQRQIILTLLLLLVVVGCVGGGEEPVDNGSLPQIFIFPGEQEKRLISQETIPQNNCDGTAELSQEVGRSYTVQYTLELGSDITVSADGRAKIPEIGEVGVGTEIAANYQVGYGRSDTVSRTQTVAAAKGSYIQHTIQQFEIWDTGELLIVMGEIKQRLPYSFRRDFSIEAVAPANIGCSGGAVESLGSNNFSDNGSTATQVEGNNTSGSSSACADTGSIPPLPLAPPQGCILILEWWIPPSTDGSNCGILITEYEPSSISADAVGTWWYVYPNRPDDHLQGFQTKNPHCGFQDLRS